MTGLSLLVRMSSTGVKSSEMPTARSSAASARAKRSARRSSPLRPSVIIGGHTVKGVLQPRDPSAFLIGADPQRKLVGELLRLAREIRDLLRRVDVAREEDDAAKVELTREQPRSAGIECPAKPAIASWPA